MIMIFMGKSNFAGIVTDHNDPSLSTSPPPTHTLPKPLTPTPLSTRQHIIFLLDYLELLPTLIFLSRNDEIVQVPRKSVTIQVQKEPLSCFAMIYFFVGQVSMHPSTKCLCHILLLTWQCLALFFNIKLGLYKR